MNVKAPKALPTIGPIGSFECDFLCTKTVTTSWPGAADVGLDEEDFCVENDEGDSCVENAVANDKGEVDVLDEILVEELRDKGAVAWGGIKILEVLQKK